MTDGQLERVAVGIEVPRGALVELLLERGAAVFALNPKQLDRFRDRFSVAGAKDDRLDARVLRSAVQTDLPPLPAVDGGRAPGDSGARAHARALMCCSRSLWGSPIGCATWCIGSRPSG